jgi:DNA-binding transcriptional MerR regulator
MASTGTATQTAAEEALYRIGEVSRLTELKTFVLRYWETEFPMLQPVKSASGHRLYRQEDVDMVFKIKRLLYDEGFTIAGARRHLREQNGSVGSGVSDGSHFATGSTHAIGAAGANNSVERPAEMLSRKMLLDMRDTLRAFLTLLERR